MKRILSLLILLFMVVSLVIPISSINDNRHIESETKIVKLDDIVGNIPAMEVNEVIIQPDPYEIAIQKMQEEMAEIENITDKKEWFLSYKDIVYKYSKWIDPPETVFDYYTEDEIRLICQAVETEAYQCDFNSKVNVANVILNRIESGEFGETVEEVITTENQFAYGRKSITDDTVLAVMFAFEFEDTTYGATYFHSNEQTETFNGKSYIFSDDAIHHFY